MRSGTRVDAHQHFWRYRPADYPWIGDSMGVLRRDYLPTDLEPALAGRQLHSSVAVQASATVAETEWLLALAETYPSVAGVVGWVDLCSADAPAVLARLAAHPRLRGIRHIVQDEPDDAFLLREDFLRGVEALVELDLTYDILIYPRQLPAAVEFVRRLPRHRLVVDHLAKPCIASGILEPWASELRRLARYDHVHCKLSGMVTEASWTSWRPEHVRPYVDVALDAFGPDRVMFGSDWPVCLLAASYEEVVDVAREAVAHLSEGDREAVFGGTAWRFYRLGGGV